MLGLTWVEREGEGEEAGQGDGSSHAFHESREGGEKGEEKPKGMGKVVFDSVGEKAEAEDEGADLGEKPSLDSWEQELFDKGRNEKEREGVGAHDDPNVEGVDISSFDFEREHRGENVALETGEKVDG